VEALYNKLIVIVKSVGVFSVLSNLAKDVSKIDEEMTPTSTSKPRRGPLDHHLSPACVCKNDGYTAGAIGLDQCQAAQTGGMLGNDKVGE